MAQDLTVKIGQCINFGNCSKANAREMIKVNLGDDFICPECEGSLMETPPKGGFPPALKWILIIVGILAVLGIGGYFGYPFIKGLLSKGEKPKNEDVHIVPVEGITLDITSLSFVNTGASRRLIATVYPINVADNNKKITWQSGNKTVATVDENGIVTAIANGNAVISAYTINGLSATCYVTVDDATPKPPKNTNTKTYSFGKYTGSLKNGIPEGDGKMVYNRRVQIAKHDTESMPHYAEAGDYFVGSWGNGDIVSGYLYRSDGSIKECIIAPKRFNPYDISKD